MISGSGLRFVVATLAALAVLVVACGGSDDDPETAATVATRAPAATAQAAAGGAVEVTLKQWAVEPGSSTVAAGEVTFTVSNAGAAPHEFAIVRSDLNPEGLPTADGAVDENRVEVVGRIDQFPGGETMETTLTLQAGSYVLICNIPAHYDLGMRAAFTVE